MVGYRQSKKDYEYLYNVREVNDLVEVDARVFELMENPTKEVACDLYKSCISQWFSEFLINPDNTLLDRRVKAIARRHGETL